VALLKPKDQSRMEGIMEMVWKWLSADRQLIAPTQTFRKYKTVIG
jgi:hypothetical protein